MATPGRKPDPASERIDPSKRRTPPGTVMEVKPPADLAPEAEDVWHSLVPLLADTGTLVPSDTVLLLELVETIALARIYRAKLWEGVRKGTVTEHDRNGDPHEVPFIGSKVEKRIRASWSDYSSQAERLASEYGLTPTARVRLGIAEAAQGVSFSEAMRALGDGS